MNYKILAMLLFSLAVSLIPASAEESHPKKQHLIMRYELKLQKFDFSGLTPEEIEYYELSESTTRSITSLRYVKGLGVMHALFQLRSGKQGVESYNRTFHQINLSPHEFLEKFNRDRPAVYEEFGFFVNGNIGIGGPYSFGDFFIIEGDALILYHVRIFLSMKDGVKQLTGYAIYSTRVSLSSMK